MKVKFRCEDGGSQPNLFEGDRMDDGDGMAAVAQETMGWNRCVEVVGTQLCFCCFPH